MSVYSPYIVFVGLFVYLNIKILLPKWGAKKHIHTLRIFFFYIYFLTKHSLYWFKSESVVVFQLLSRGGSILILQLKKNTPIICKSTAVKMLLKLWMFYKQNVFKCKTWMCSIQTNGEKYVIPLRIAVETWASGSEIFIFVS